jgi:hypothetical protein
MARGLNAAAAGAANPLVAARDQAQIDETSIPALDAQTVRGAADRNRERDAQTEPWKHPQEAPSHRGDAGVDRHDRGRRIANGDGQFQDRRAASSGAKRDRVSALIDVCSRFNIAARKREGSLAKTAKARTSICRRVLIAGLGLSAAHAAQAQPTQAQKDAIRKNCRSDYMSYCSSVPTGGAASLQCLRQHGSNLSGACAKAVDAIGGGSGTSPGGAPAAASSENAPAQIVTPAVSGPVSAPAPVVTQPMAPAAQAPPPPARMYPRQEAALIRNQCGMDFRRFCRGVRFGGGRAVECLTDNQNDLSRGCRSALMSLR